MPARSVIFRLLAAAPLCVMSACASNAASQADVGALRAEVQALRETQARLTERLQRLEAHDAVEKARTSGAPARATPADASASGDGLGTTPELAVVKLKPRNEPAPKLPTAVPVVEPDTEQMEMFISAVPEGAAAASGGEAATVVASRDDDADAKDPDVLDAEYDKAVSLLRTGNVEGGVERLRRFAEENPRHPRADNALYFSGLGLIGLSEFKDAARTFERLIKTYPAGDAMLDSMLRLAECRMRLNQAADAKALYTRVVTQFPGTAAATQAEQRLAALPQ
ncbi:tetratricopeptide repeat protein [Pyxidicoccus sp. MSG2]|uniref:tetratricopeptide repeat protein n=1 Tax=Pyxidicoccus sp. MSG2 TaxID=2996790 RepID=UPI0022706401|nr:tetratricopeptide repeat protein [Pyxidicoccus sp. MSG2]MCY1014823.1 tetratricopeptide repeat protein [Pyxidicoccus sp. MSG2]